MEILFLISSSFFLCSGFFFIISNNEFLYIGLILGFLILNSTELNTYYLLGIRFQRGS